jgi:protein-arginine kinase activator protein McsA
LDSAGILMEDTAASKKRKPAEIEEPTGESGDLRSLSLDELNKLLNEVLEQEDYLKAIAIRDEINNRKKNRG